jgi:flagella basal body P-ring formation protein FlgA
MLQFLCPTQAFRAVTLALLMGPCAFGGVALAKADPREALMAETQAWLVTELKLSPTLLSLTPLNPKLRVRACDSGWQWKNFPDQSTVQASCAQPRTLFLIQWKTQSTPSPVVASSTAKLPKPPQPVGAVSSEPPLPPTPTVTATRKALSINQTLPRGSHLTPAMLSWVEIPATSWAGHHLSDMAAAQGAELTRDMRPGQVLSKNDIRPSVMVKKGQLVTIHIGEPGKMNISAQLQALQDGRIGETINLKNPESGRLLSGVVTGLNAVRNP